MYRKLIMVFLAVMTLASMSVAPSAFAESKPSNQFRITRIKADCSVRGDVLITPGIQFPTPHKNVYRLIGTRILCVSNGTLTNWGPFGTLKRFDVRAQGCTDGPFLLNGRSGETSVEGWSSSSGCSRPYVSGLWDNKDDCNKKANDNYNKGNILVRQREGPKLARGWVKFYRKGNVVKAWGKLQWALALKKQLCFVVNLGFTPVPPVPPLAPVTSARLDGTAQVGNGAVPDPKK